MGKKYKLTEESINYYDKKLYRIEALKDFANVKKGDKGGYVESEANLSQEGNCWIYDSALVFGDAMVYENAKVCCKARIYGEAQVYDNALVGGNALISGNAEICDNAYIDDNAVVCGNAKVCSNAKILGNSEIFDNALIYGNAKIYGNAQIRSSAKVENITDYIVFKNWWSSGRYFTWTRSNNMWAVGCFYGTGEELIAKAYEDSEISGREYERIVNYVKLILQNSKQIMFDIISNCF